MNESCHSHERVMSHIWMSHGTHMNESYHTHEWVMSLTWMSHVTHMNESCHSHEWVMSLTWMSHGTHVNESYHTYEWVMSLTWMSHVAHMNESCHSHEWVMSLTWMSHVTHMNESCHTYEWVTSHTWMSHVTHMNESHHSHEHVTSTLAPPPSRKFNTLNACDKSMDNGMSRRPRRSWCAPYGWRLPWRLCRSALPRAVPKYRWLSWLICLYDTPRWLLCACFFIEVCTVPRSSAHAICFANSCLFTWHCWPMLSLYSPWHCITWWQSPVGVGWRGLCRMSRHAQISYRLCAHAEWCRISWRSKRQATVSLSSAESEFIAASQYGQEVVYLREF